MIGRMRAGRSFDAPHCHGLKQCSVDLPLEAGFDNAVFDPPSGKSNRCLRFSRKNNDRRIRDLQQPQLFENGVTALVAQSKVEKDDFERLLNAKRVQRGRGRAPQGNDMPRRGQALDARLASAVSSSTSNTLNVPSIKKLHAS